VRAIPPYTEVHNENGFYMVKSSLRNVIIEMTDNEALGLRVHRSYWVAYSEFKKLIYKNGNPALILKNDDVIPLSRTSVKQVKLWMKYKTSEHL